MAVFNAVLPAAARRYIELGLSALPANRQRKYPIGDWKEFQSALPPADHWNYRADAICVVTGQVSGNLELIDFDFQAEYFESWREELQANAPSLFERLVIEKSQSGGRHAFYRCNDAVIEGNQDLAKKYIETPNADEISYRGKTIKPRKVGDKFFAEVCLIETRGEGGLVLCDPSPGYEFVQGSFDDIPIITAEERAAILDSAKRLSQERPVPKQPTKPRAETPSTAQADRPGDDFNARGDFVSLLEAEGWVHIGDDGVNQLWRRPGKNGDGTSATLKEKQFYVFSTNAAPFEANTCYGPFAIYALLKHDGDYEAAAKALAADGYGEQKPQRKYDETEHNPWNDDYVEGQILPEVDLNDVLGSQPTYASASFEPPPASEKYEAPPEDKAAYRDQVALANSILKQVRAQLPAEDIDGLITNYTEQRRVLAEGEGPKPLGDLMRKYREQRPPIIHGLLREGETMNLIAPPKVGKSWLIYDLALSVVTGQKWLAKFETVQGDVLLIDNELYPESIATRIPKVADEMKLDYADYANGLQIESLRGRLRDINSMNGYFARLEPGRFKLVIIDAWYRALPKDTDENANGDMTSLYNLIDSYAQRLGCAFVLIHHASKGNQSGKSVTDVGAGAGAQSRAADAHMILRPHEEENVVVLDGVVRSWPSFEPTCLRWEWPLWEVDPNLDPTLLRKEKRSDRGKEPPTGHDWTGEQFAQAFGSIEPKQGPAIIDAAIKGGLSDRKASELLKRAKAIKALHEWPGRQYATVPPPNSTPAPDPGTDGENGPGTSGGAPALFKRDSVELAIQQTPTATDSEIARTHGVDRRYVGRIRKEMKETAEGAPAPAPMHAHPPHPPGKRGTKPATWGWT